jgi:membrane fusion protein (multidrug efflux system)
MYQQPRQGRAAAARQQGGRGRLAGLVALFAVAGVMALAASAYWSVTGRISESTDDAYVAGDIVQVSAPVAGMVADIAVDNTQHVKAGQVLLRLDDADATLALVQAEAELAMAVQQADGARLARDQAARAVEAREAEMTLASSALAARSNAPLGIVSREELAHARESYSVAAAGLAAARSQLASAELAAGPAAVADNPNVLRAAALVKQAYMAKRHTVITAPVSGTIAQRAVQIGHKISPGMPLMSIVPLDRVWVEANFKESQISHIHLGQPARIVSDVYGSDVSFHGRVRGLSAGTGSAFSMLPPQNAAGNWIKVLQRIPVIVSIDPAELAANPLRVGFSMQVTVDTSGPARDQAAGGAPWPPPLDEAPDTSAKEADDLVAQLIHARQ